MDRTDDAPLAAMPDMVPGELAELLLLIEAETAPERLLDLAVRLQAALQMGRVSSAEQQALVEG